jgi:soluble lytic murein transglycosylase
MVSIRNPWLWGVGLVLLLLVLAGVTLFALRSRPQTAAVEARPQPIPTWTNTPASVPASGAPEALATPTPQGGSSAAPVAAGQATAEATGGATDVTPPPATPPLAPEAGADAEAPAQSAPSDLATATDTTAAPASVPPAGAGNAGGNTGGQTGGAAADTGDASPVIAAALPGAPGDQIGGAASPAGLLAQGLLLHRYGDYANARTLLARLAADATLDGALRREAQYNLGRAYLGEGLYGEALATFDQLDAALAAAGADTAEFGGKEQFLRGEALLGEGQYSDAIAAYWRFLDAYPWMGESVQPRIAAAYLALNDPASAAAAFRRAAEVSSDNPSRARLLERVAQAHVDASQYGDAVTAYDEILAFAANAAYRAQLQYQAGQALSTAGDGPGAISRWRAATEEAPESPSAYLALVEIVNRNGDFDLYQRGYIDLFADAYEPAIAAFQAYLDATDPSDARHASALHRLGQSYLGAGNYAEAITRLDQVIAQYPGCDCFGLAWLHKAMAQAGLGDTAAARRTYRTFARDYPDDAQAPEALWLSGRMALDEDNQIEAAVDFMALADRFPASERAPQALYALGLGAVTKQLYAEAAPVFERLQNGYPDYRFDAVAYWLGRAYGGSGSADAARSTWQALVDRAPDTYYGVLGGFALAEIPMENAAVLGSMGEIRGPQSRLDGDDGSQAFAEQWLATWITTTTAAELAALPTAVAEDQNLAKGRLLLEMDQRGDALAALERVYDNNADNPHALYALSLEFARLGAYRLSLLSAARLLILSGVDLVEDGPIFIQRLAYPLPFNDLIVREAQANDINPLVYFSLIRQESLFEEGAQSSAAAQGLAQIIPDTGHWIAGQLGHPEYTNEIIYRPVINLRFGAYYLDWVRDYLDGNLLSALVGYNAGPGNSATWREQSGPDDTVFAEILTFTEPRIYIQTVVANLYHYTRLYQD